MVALLAGALPCCGWAQAPALPATAPTAVPATAQTVSQLPSAQPRAAVKPSHLVVLYDGVALQVDATNVSLASVLREIAVKTKLNITGRAPSERIFGTYGPGPLNLVVPALLEGLAVNALLTERSGGAASELVLTAREGLPTSSAVPTQQSLDEDDAPPPQAAPPVRAGRLGGPGGPGGQGPGYASANASAPGQTTGPIAGPTLGDNGVNGGDNGINGPNNGVNGADNGIGVAPSGTDVNANGSASPNGVRTPQEIFEQLQRLRQQQAAPQ